MSFLFSSSSSSSSSIETPTLLQQEATKAQKFLLTAVPSGSGAGGQKKKSPVKLSPLAKDGVDKTSFYNMVGGRPFPHYASIEQSIRVELVQEVPVELTTSTVVNSFSTFNLALSALSGYTNYTALFDQYKVEQIEAWLEPVAAQGTTVFGFMASCVDLDDANIPSTIASVQDHQSALVGMGAAGRRHCWRPHMAVATFSGAFTSYANEVAGWIDSASPNVQHFGLKIACAPTPVAIGYNLTIRAVVSFRAPGIS